MIHTVGMRPEALKEVMKGVMNCKILIQVMKARWPASAGWTRE